MLVAAHKASAYLIVISPGSCDHGHITASRELVRTKKDECIVFVSNKRENNSELSLTEIKEIIKNLGVSPENTYTELNKCVSRIRDDIQ